MRNIWRELMFLVLGLALITIALLLSGCAVAKNESGAGSAVALGSACAANISPNSYQFACAKSGAMKIEITPEQVNSGSTK